MASATPRAVFVVRETDYELLLARHATREQACFFLETRGQRIEELEELNDRFSTTLALARAAVPPTWRQALVRREDFSRFLFGPEDIVIAVGKDGLVANIAKYLDGQPVLGVNPAPERYDGVLVRVPLDRLARVLPAAAAGDIAAERRTMVQAVLDGGERLLALNEVFVGHRSHQSARYRISFGGVAEDQSSSGLIVASGSGATGWARSIMAATGHAVALGPEERAAAFLVREPFPSVATGIGLSSGKLTDTPLLVTSQMNDGGVIFADGIERDFLAFDWGRTLALKPAQRTLRLIVG